MIRRTLSTYKKLAIDNTWLCLTGAELTHNDAICQRALTQVLVAWEPFEDPESEIVRYDKVDEVSYKM